MLSKALYLSKNPSIYANFIRTMATGNYSKNVETYVKSKLKSGQVTLYTLSDCPSCREAINFLQEK
jgi:hypothetical protein